MSTIFDRQNQIKEITEHLESRQKRQFVKAGSQRLAEIEENAEEGIYPDETWATMVAERS